MPTLETDGETIHYAAEGAGPAVLLLHSLGGSSAMWRSTLAALSGTRRVLAPDAVGHGGSSRNRPFTIQRNAAQALALLDAEGIDRAAVVGLSMGGLTGLEMALAAPDRLTALVLADSSAGGRGDGAARLAGARDGLARLGPDGFAHEFAASRLMPATDPAMVAAYGADVRRTLPDGLLEALESLVVQDFRARLPEIATPTLVLVGDHDAGTPLPMAETLRDGIPGATLQVIPDAGHFSVLDQPALFDRLVAAFLDGRQ